ncbi:P-selectin-like isoform X3 [Narcine bancroftii]|uniref:P-selectin-like isoform X3 n=1 Tax=Narcine bancroftii TaxID=1343680 RepID=UPI0038312AB5
MKMESHGSVNWACRQSPQVQNNSFRLLTLIVISEILMSGRVHGWIYHYSNKTRNWKNARKWCQHNYTDMVAIQNMEENRYLMEYLPKGSAHVWIGLRRIHNIWTWIGTNRTIKSEAMNWAPGEPNNKKKREDCVEMYIKVASNAGKWNDEPCLRKKRPLCFQASCNPDSCNGHGECVETIGAFKCVCNEGFHGEQCEKVLKCLRLEHRDQAIMNCFHPNGLFSYNSICNFSCAEGFQTHEARKLKCTASAEWSASIPKCKAIRCSGLETSKKDNMKCTHPFGYFSYNSTCTFGCREGYVLHGSERLQCSASGQWTDRPPFCKVQQCETLVAPEHGNMSCIHPIANFRYNSTCAFSCSDGFTLNGSSRLQCKVSGEWTGQKPTCEAMKCSELKVPPNLLMNCSDPFKPFSYTSSCNFSCKDGFTLQGSDRVQCDISGQWTSKVPVCEAVQCKPLKIPKQGDMNCINMFGNFSYNSTCIFSCIEGFVLNGSSNLHCQASKQWTEEIPTCEVVKCTTLEDPEQGTINCSHPLGLFHYNTTCDFSCERGFTLSGSDTVRCGANGQWITQIPSCKAVTCQTLTDPEQGAMNCSHPIRDFSYSSMCDFNCVEGFALRGSKRLRCQDNGQWTAQNPKCEVIICERLMQPKQGAVNCTHPIGEFSYRSTCDFSCADGFVLNGSDSLQCRANGQWTAQNPSCEVVTCQTLTDPEQGAMNCSHPIGDFCYSSMCDFSCVEGFALRGSKRLRCQNNGQWTAQNPKCEVIICERLMQPKQGAVNCTHPIGEFSYRSTCDFSCADGFVLNGSDSLQCRANGQWTAQNPSCEAVTCQTLADPEQGAMNCSHPIRDFSYSSMCDFNCVDGFALRGSKRLRCQDNGQWTAQNPKCEVIICERLIQPKQGAVNCTHPIGEFSYRSTCEFSCADGFELNGSDSLQCQANGQWTAQNPSCEAVTCQTLTDPEQGAMNCSHPIRDFSYSSMCDFNCVEGFALRGSKRLRCQDNGQWTAQNPKCEVIICERLMQPKQGAVNCTHPIGEFSYQSTCDFSCADGFVLNGSNSLQCRANGQWTAQNPSCEVVKCQELITYFPVIMNCSHPLGNFSYHSLCDFDCFEDFTLEGSARLQCNRSGQWTEEIPFCGVLSKQTPEVDFLMYVGGIAATAIFGLIIAMTMIWIRRKLKSQVLKLHKIRLRTQHS